MISFRKTSAALLFSTLAALFIIAKDKPNIPRKVSDTSDAATIRYRAMYNLAYLPEMVTTNRIDYYYITSHKKEVKATDITLIINSKTGQIPIQILEHGEFKLPYSRELLSENPPIVSNQPKGTLAVECLYRRRVVVPENRVVPYRKMIEPDIMARAMCAIIDGKTNVIHMPRSVYFYAGTDIHTNATIRSSKGDVLIHADKPGKSGFFELPITPEHMAENPDVILPSLDVEIIESCGYPYARISGRVSKF